MVVAHTTLPWLSATPRRRLGDGRTLVGRGGRRDVAPCDYPTHYQLATQCWNEFFADFFVPLHPRISALCLFSRLWSTLLMRLLREQRGLLASALYTILASPPVQYVTD